MIYIRHGEPDPPERFHAIEAEEDELLHTRAALCGWRPIRAWSSQDGDEVTCPACLDLIGGVTDRQAFS